MIVNLTLLIVFNCQLLAPLDNVYPRIGNLMSLVLFWHPLIEAFERLCILLPTLTLLNFYKKFQIFYLFEDKINPKIVIGILFLSRLF